MEKGLTVILPAFNEEANIKDVIFDIVQNIRKYIEDFEIIVIDDGSTDATLNIITKMQQLYPQLKVKSHEENKGYGCALKTGIELAKKEYIFFIDADSQFDISDFRLCWENRQKYDFILGYRKNRKDNVHRIILGRAGNFLSNLLLRKMIKDINCGFKLFRASSLKRLSLISTGGLIYFEILYNLLTEKRNFLQLAVNHHERKKGTPSGGKLKVITKIIGEGIKLIGKNGTDTSVPLQ